jgi:hypothetical protein
MARHGLEPAAQHLEPPRNSLAVTALLGRARDLAALGGRVEERGEDLVAGHAVGRRVVELREQAEVPVAQAVEQVELPQRPGAVEGARADPRDRLGDLALVAGRRDRRLAHVVLDVEVGVLDPVGQVEVERDLDEPPAKRRNEVQPLLHAAPQVLDGHRPAGGGRRVVDPEHADVAERPRRLDPQEVRVEARQLVHDLVRALVWPGAAPTV